MSASALHNSGDSHGTKEVQAAGQTVPVATYTFGNFILDRQRACLFRDGQEIKLRPKSFELLAYLAENHGRLITKDELMKDGLAGLLRHRRFAGSVRKGYTAGFGG